MKKYQKQVPATEEWWAKYVTLDYQLGELAFVCEEFTIMMGDDLVFEVWGKMRWGPNAERMMKLAVARGDLHEVVGLAYVTAMGLETSSAVQDATVPGGAKGAD